MGAAYKSGRCGLQVVTAGFCPMDCIFPMWICSGVTNRWCLVQCSDITMDVFGMDGTVLKPNELLFNELLGPLGYLPSLLKVVIDLGWRWTMLCCICDICSASWCYRYWHHYLLTTYWLLENKPVRVLQCFSEVTKALHKSPVVRTELLGFGLACIVFIVLSVRCRQACNCLSLCSSVLYI